MILTITIFTIVNIFLAQIDSRKIGENKLIKHGLNGLVYAAILAVPYFLFSNYWLIGALLFNRLLVFNIALSVFRGLKWDYISPEPKAITDKLAKAVFRNNGMLMYGVYLLIFTGFIIKLFI